MPRFFFDIVEGGEVQSDIEGLDLTDITAAKLEARRALAELLQEAIELGPQPSRGQFMFHIRDSEERRVVLALAYEITERVEEPLP